MTEGVDYSFSRPGGAALEAAGKHFALRYVPYIGDGGKGLTRAELADLFEHGIDVGLVWETTAGRARGGRSAGVADANRALIGLESLRFPAGRPVYFAVDYQAFSYDMPAIRAYLDGAASVLGRDRIGVYGSAGVVDAMHSVGAASFFWQTYAWSGGRLSPHADLFQYRNGQTIDGSDVDLDRSLVDDFGQWAANPREVPMQDIDAANTTPLLVDLEAGTKILNLDGTLRQTSTAARTGVISPFGTTSPGNTALRAIVWTRPDPDPDLVLAVYGNTVRNARPLVPAGISEADAAAATKAAVKAAVDHISEAHDAEGAAISEAYLR